MYRLSKLKNGTNLITIPLKGTKSLTAMVLFPIGSRYEDKNLSGASHFVEHMLFKGTQKRPTYLDISRELDAVGAEYNAFTYKDYTGYYVKVSSAKTKLAFDFLSDIVFNSRIDKEEMDKERGVIIEELRMYEDNPGMAVDLLCDKALFGDHPLGWDIAGTMETLKSITRDQLWDYYKKYYFPHNMVLVVSGNINAKAKKFLKYFSDIKQTGGSDLHNKYRAFSWSDSVPLEKRIQVSQKKLDQANVIMGFPGIKHNHPDRYAASVLLNILGGGMSSRLFVEVREKRGLAYVINVGGASFRDVGVANVQIGLDPSRLDEALKVIRQELVKLKDEPVSAKELENAKSNIAGRLALGMEDSSAQAQWFARQFWFSNKMETFETYIQKIKKVTAKDVKRLAGKIFDFDQMRLAVVGPESKEKILQVIKSISK